MSVSELEKRFITTLDDFKKEIQDAYSEDSQEPATKHDVNELARYTEYALEGFAESIIEYLKSM